MFCSQTSIQKKPRPFPKHIQDAQIRDDRLWKKKRIKHKIKERKCQNESYDLVTPNQNVPIFMYIRRHVNNIPSEDYKTGLYGHLTLMSCQMIV